MNLTQSIQQKATDLGFVFCGFAKARELTEEAKRLDQWLSGGLHGSMSYMENHFNLRIDPTQLVPGAKSVICLAYNYYTKQMPTQPNALKISKYAYGVDYHKLLRKKLKNLFNHIQTELSTTQLNGRCFVDSAPLLERQWANLAGLGWQGKHTLLINKKAGSFFFLAFIVLDVVLDYDAQAKDYCGTCTRCIQACPTQAIDPKGYLVDGSKCISYLTIELKDQIPENFKNKLENYIFGCDICQEVCPWNRFSKAHEEPEFNPPPNLLNMTTEDWQQLTAETFEKLFQNSAIKRTKLEGLKRNIQFMVKD